jgi:hypothetical protein
MAFIDANLYSDKEKHKHKPNAEVSLSAVCCLLPAVCCLLPAVCCLQCTARACPLPLPSFVCMLPPPPQPSVSSREQAQGAGAGAGAGAGGERGVDRGAGAIQGKLLALADNSGDDGAPQGRQGQQGQQGKQGREGKESKGQEQDGKGALRGKITSDFSSPMMGRRSLKAPAAAAREGSAALSHATVAPAHRVCITVATLTPHSCATFVTLLYHL